MKIRNCALRSGSLLASTQKVHRLKSQFLLHFDIESTWQIRSSKSFSSTWCLLPAALLERWPHVCRIKITFTVLLTNRFDFTTTNSM